MEREAATVRRFYDAFARDPDAVADCFTDDAVWSVPGRSPIGGDYKGWTSIRDDFFSSLSERTAGTFHAELVDVLVGRRVVAAFVHATAARPGKKLDITVCQVMRFRDGRIAEVRGHYADTYALDEFWS